MRTVEVELSGVSMNLSPEVWTSSSRDGRPVAPMEHPGQYPGRRLGSARLCRFVAALRDRSGAAAHSLGDLLDLVVEFDGDLVDALGSQRGEDAGGSVVCEMHACGIGEDGHAERRVESRCWREVGHIPGNQRVPDEVQRRLEWATAQPEQRALVEPRKPDESVGSAA